MSALVQSNIFKVIANFNKIYITAPILTSSFHTTSSTAKWNTQNIGPKKFLTYNKTIFPPQQPDEEPRPAVNERNISILFE